MREFLINQKPPTAHVFINKTTKMKIGKITDKHEIVLLLKPGLRYEDYQKAWEVFSSILGGADRLAKPYADEELSLQMLNDKNKGLTYMDITKKYYPDKDPEMNYERVKKMIQRTRKRFERDK